MTAGNNGAGTPENDDPFAYLYRSEGGEGAANGAASDGSSAQYGRPAQQPGVPRTSYNQVRRVGERQYGGQQASYQPGYGPPRSQQPVGHAQSPNPAYAAPETLPGGAPHRAAQPGHGGGHGGHGGGGRGPNSRGLLIGAIAVVAVVVIGIAVAMMTNNADDSGTDPSEANSQQTAPVEESGGQQDEPGGKDKDEAESGPYASGKEDAAALRLGGGATVASDVPGAKSESGSYVAGMNVVGSTATWKTDVPKSGQYTLFVGYGVPGKDTEATLSVNGKPRVQELKNWANAGAGEWDKGWTTTFAWVDLPKGTNTFELSCGEGQACEFNLDWVQLKEGKVQK